MLVRRKAKPMIENDDAKRNARFRCCMDFFLSFTLLILFRERSKRCAKSDKVARFCSAVNIKAIKHSFFKLQIDFMKVFAMRQSVCCSPLLQFDSVHVFFLYSFYSSFTSRIQRRERKTEFKN